MKPSGEYVGLVVEEDGKVGCAFMRQREGSRKYFEGLGDNPQDHLFLDHTVFALHGSREVVMKRVPDYATQHALEECTPLPRSEVMVHLD